MVRIIVDLDSATLGRIREILRSGDYENVEEFVWVSVSNQLHLESTDKSEAGWRTIPVEAIARGNTGSDPLAILTSKGSGYDIETFDVTPITEPLWGMYYRYLPLKVAVRSIACIGGESADKIFHAIGGAALALGTEIREYEKRMAIKRGYGNSQGLPGRRKDVDASINRYLNLYVGTTLKRTGRVTGMMYEMGFGSIKEGRIPVLSEDGLGFAKLENPAVDDRKFDTPLSEEEKQFLLEHIWKKMPSEQDFMKRYLNILQNGTRTPSEIASQMNDYLRKKLPGQEPTESVISTMTSGVQSRMIELGLVSFKRVGTSSEYGITDSGRLFLEGGPG